MRVWYNGRTSAFQADDAGSIPATRSKKYDTSIGEIHQIVREYKLNELNFSVFKILTERV